MLNKKIVNIDINDEKYIGALDVKAMIHYKKENGVSLLTDLSRMYDKKTGLDEILMLQILGSVLRPEGGSPVGIDFIDSFDITNVLSELTPILMDLVHPDNIPMDVKKKQTKKKKVK